MKILCKLDIQAIQSH